MKNILQIAKSKLMLEHPYFGSIVTNLNIIENNKIASISKKGDVLEINSEYLKMLDIDEVSAILANSALRQQLFHSQRGETKVKSVWSMASDYAINDMLYQNGFKIPPLSNFSSRFDRLYAEEIYKILITEMDIDNSDTKESNQDVATIEDLDYNIFLEQMINKYSKSGELPDGIERFVEIKSSKISWRDILSRFINNFVKIDYRLFPSNKKYLYQGIILPAIRGEELKLAIAIDTSGSIDNSALNSFISEVEAIMQSFSSYKITLIECDHKIRDITEYEPLQSLTPKLIGGGATDFRDVFNYVEEYNFNCLIYFSDAEGIFPNYQPNFETLWVLTKDTTTPFGETIIIDCLTK